MKGESKMRKIKQWFNKTFEVKAPDFTIYEENWKDLYKQVLDFMNENQLRPEEVKFLLRWDTFRAHLDIFYFTENEFKEETPPTIVRDAELPDLKDLDLYGKKSNEQEKTEQDVPKIHAKIQLIGCPSCHSYFSKKA